MACYVIIYVMANVFGIYHQILTNISQEDAFKNTIKFLNGRIQLEKEKQQQVSHLIMNYLELRQTVKEIYIFY